MGSSGGSSGGGGYMLSSVGPAIEGLPVAGKDSTIGNPFEYGKFQSFLPDLASSGKNPMATGLTPEMLQYKSPSGVTQQSDTTAQVQQLRDALAQLTATQQATQATQATPQYTDSAVADQGGNYNPNYGGG